MSADGYQTLILNNGAPSSPPPSPAAAATAPLFDPPPAEVDAALRRLEAFLSALGLSHSSTPLLLYSLAAFTFLGVAVPVAVVRISECEGSCEVYRVLGFEINVVVSQTLLSGSALAFVSTGLRRYGVRRLVCADRGTRDLERFRNGYAEGIGGFFKLLFWWILPGFVVKTVREIVRFVYISGDSEWKAIVILLLSITSWLYLTMGFLSACMLFNLVCTLQLIHFEDFIMLFGTDTDIFTCLEEHIHLRYYLYKISHRFRAYLLHVFFVVSASETISLIQTTGFYGGVNFINAGDLALASVVQVVGTVLCLNAASKISHRVQSIASVASKWHALITCSDSDSSHATQPSSYENIGRRVGSSLTFSTSEVDLESFNNAAMQETLQVASNGSSYQKRQALVTYLQTNPGGITIYGFTVDRALINTIFAIELSLVLFVLGKTLVFSED